MILKLFCSSKFTCYCKNPAPKGQKILHSLPFNPFLFQETKTASVDILLFIVDYSPSLVREYMMQVRKPNLLYNSTFSTLLSLNTVVLINLLVYIPFFKIAIPLIP
jgi:hypothetical protein